MKNHFIFPYPGNKRQEVEIIYNSLNLENIKTIVEPFCGTSAISYYINYKYPNKFKFIINDDNEYLINIYKLIKDNKKIKKFENEINKVINKFNKCKTNDERKVFWSEIEKNQTTNIYYWFFIKKYSVRCKLCPLFERTKELKKFLFIDYPISDFIKNENIKIYNIDAVDIINKYKDDESALIILDPPYLRSFNDFYKNNDLNIYFLIILITIKLM